MKDVLFRVMAFVSGQTYTPLWEDKIMPMFFALLAIAVLLIIFVYIFFKYVKSDSSLNVFFLSSAVLLFVVIITKFIIFKFWKGYIPDRLPFYVLPSPKVENFIFFLIVIFLFILFLKFRYFLRKVSLPIFLFSLFCIFIIFSLSLSGLREGTNSIQDPLTYTNWQYSGDIPFINSTHDFLTNYKEIRPLLSEHSQTHPPGYSLLLYYFSKFVGVSFLWMAILITTMVGLSIAPVYFLLKFFFPEQIARDVTQIYLFIPSIILVSGTSVDGIFIFVVWWAIFFLVKGFEKSSFFSIIGGILAGIALFCNFLFILLSPLFVGIVFFFKNKNYSWFSILRNVVIVFLSFFLFFGVLWLWTGYSIIENFKLARAVQDVVVISNFSSLRVYSIFFIMNTLSFFLGLGISNIILFFVNRKIIFSRINFHASFAFIFVFGLFALGIFQGELMRIFMFIIPIFLPSIGLTICNMKYRQINIYLSLLFLQSIFMQIVFYVYRF